MTQETFRCKNCGGEDFTGTAVIAVAITHLGLLEPCLSEVWDSIEQHEVSCNDCDEVGNINDFLEDDDVQV